MFAVFAGDLESTKLLVAGGADINATSGWGFTPLTVATYSDFGSGFRMYEGDMVPLDGERGVPGQFPEIMEFLLASGADPNVGAERFTALHAAVLRENQKQVDLLLAHGADPNLAIGDWTPVERGNPADYIHKSWVGATPLWLAARFSTPGIVESLLERGADPTFVHHGVYYGGRPGGALSERQEEVSTILMAALRMAGGSGRAWNLTAPAFSRSEVDNEDASEEMKVLEIVKLLVEKGVDIDAVDHTDRTAVSAAMEAGYDSVVEFLVANGGKMPEEPVQPPSRRGRGGP
jgi:hypothetical protein